MELRQIESVYWVHKLGSFSAAAQLLNTTQPNISGRIQALEREIGSLIFDRSGRKARLTDQGHAMLGDIGRIVESMQALKHHAKGTADISGTIRLGVTNTIAQTWLSTLIEQLSARYVNLDIDFHVDTYATLKPRFRNHEIDLLICTEHISEPDIISDFLYRTTFDWVASPHIRFESNPITVEELARHRIVTYSPGTRLHNFVIDYFKNCGTAPSRLSRSNSLAAMMHLVSSGVGVCAIPGVAIGIEYADRLRVLNVEALLPPIDFFASYVDNPSNQTVSLVTQSVRDICQKF